MTLRLQVFHQCGADIGKAAGLGQRRKLSGNETDTKRHGGSLSRCDDRPV
jgi:hypothetical protein